MNWFFFIFRLDGLQQGTHEAGERFGGFAPHGALLPLFKGDFVALGNVVIEDGSHPGVESSAVNEGIALEIVLKTAEVEVCGTG